MAVLGPDIYLDPLTGDLDLSRGGDLRLVADVAQRVQIRLQFFRGEWFLDRDAGVPYFDQVFVKGPNLAHLRALFRTVIVETPGVGAVRAFDLSYEPTTRILSLAYTADTDSGEISAEVQI